MFGKIPGLGRVFKDDQKKIKDEFNKKAAKESAEQDALRERMAQQSSQHPKLLNYVSEINSAIKTLVSNEILSNVSSLTGELPEIPKKKEVDHKAVFEKIESLGELIRSRFSIDSKYAVVGNNENRPRTYSDIPIILKEANFDFLAIPDLKILNTLKKTLDDLISESEASGVEHSSLIAVRNKVRIGLETYIHLIGRDRYEKNIANTVAKSSPLFAEIIKVETRKLDEEKLTHLVATEGRAHVDLINRSLVNLSIPQTLDAVMKLGEALLKRSADSKLTFQSFHKSIGVNDLNKFIDKASWADKLKIPDIKMLELFLEAVVTETQNVSTAVAAAEKKRCDDNKIPDNEQNKTVEITHPDVILMRHLKETVEAGVLAYSRLVGAEDYKAKSAKVNISDQEINEMAKKIKEKLEELRKLQSPTPPQATVIASKK